MSSNRCVQISIVHVTTEIYIKTFSRVTEDNFTLLVYVNAWVVMGHCGPCMYSPVFIWKHFHFVDFLSHFFQSMFLNEFPLQKFSVVGGLFTFAPTKQWTKIVIFFNNYCEFNRRNFATVFQVYEIWIITPF